MGFLTALVRGKEVDSLVKQVENLLDEKKKLKEELEDIKLQKRLEQEEIKHMVRINEEKNKMEVEQEKVKLAKENAEQIAKFKEEQRVALVESLKTFHEKMESRFNTELGNLKEIYQALMSRLPTDAQNLFKSSCDALQEIIYKNDKQIKHAEVVVLENSDSDNFIIIRILKDLNL